MKSLRISRSTLAAGITLITLLSLIGVFGTLNQEQPEQVKFLDWGTPPQMDPKRSIHGNPTTSMGLPISAIYLPPQSIQDLVNRVDAVITGTISAIGNTANEGPYNDSQGVNQLTQAGYPALVITVTYYTITVDEILLNDHNIAANPILRLGGSHSESLPQVGETFLFALDVNPDRKSYGIIENWNLIPLDGGPIQNFDGTEPGYPGVTNEQSLKSAIQKAVTTRSPSQPSDWPKRSFIPDENADN